MTYNQRNWFVRSCGKENYVSHFESLIQRGISAIDCDRLIINYNVVAAAFSTSKSGSLPNACSERHDSDVSVSDIIYGPQTRGYTAVYIIISGKQSFTLIIHGTCPAPARIAIEKMCLCVLCLGIRPGGGEKKLKYARGWGDSKRIPKERLKMMYGKCTSQ